jgi:plasmid stabilization system protein ParE
MSKIRITDDAKNDINESAKFYEKRQKELGHDFLEEVEVSLARIRENPKQFPQEYREVRKALTDRFPHQVLFVIRSFGIIVFAVFHTSKNPDNWKKRADNELKDL